MFWLFVVILGVLCFVDLFIATPVLDSAKKESKPPHPPVDWL